MRVLWATLGVLALTQGACGGHAQPFRQSTAAKTKVISAQEEAECNAEQPPQFRIRDGSCPDPP